MEFLKKGKGCIVFGFGKLKFKNVDKTTLDDQAHIQDYENAEVIGHVRLGKSLVATTVSLIPILTALSPG